MVHEDLDDKVPSILIYIICFERQNQNIQQNSHRFKILMEFVGQILIELETSSIQGFPELKAWCPFGSDLCKHTGNHSVTTEACTSLARSVWYGGLEAHWSYLRYATADIFNQHFLKNDCISIQFLLKFQISCANR